MTIDSTIMLTKNPLTWIFNLHLLCEPFTKVSVIYSRDFPFEGLQILEGSISEVFGKTAALKISDDSTETFLKMDSYTTSEIFRILFL